MIPEILNIIEFRSNIEIYKPIIEALNIIKKYYNIGTHYFSDCKDISIDGVIRLGMKDAIIFKNDNGKSALTE